MSPCVAVRKCDARNRGTGVERPRCFLWFGRCLGGASTGRNAADSLKRRSQASAEREGSPPLGAGEGAWGRVGRHVRTGWAAPGVAARSAARRAGGPYLVCSITTLLAKEGPLLHSASVGLTFAVVSEGEPGGCLISRWAFWRYGTGRAVCDNNSTQPTRLGVADKLRGTMQATAPLLYSVPDAAKLLAISRRTLEREIAAGRFPRPLKIGRSSRVSSGDVVAYLDRLRTEQGGRL